MVRAWLRDDPACALPPGDGLVPRVAVALDDDCYGDLPASSPTGGGDGDPETPVVDDPRQEVTISQRSRLGYDTDGNPVFGWKTVLTGTAAFASVRREFDHVAGLTRVHATAMIEYTGMERIFETAVLHRVSDETMWRVVGTAQPYGRIELDLRMIDQQTQFDIEPTGPGVYTVEGGSVIDAGDGTYEINEPYAEPVGDGTYEIGD